MIISIGARTDITNYYSEWFLERIKEGFVYSRNPLFPHKVTRYDLTPDSVDCIIFCSKNYSKILPHMKEISEKFRIYCHYTITAYGKDIEPNVPGIEESIETLQELSKIIGKKKVAWRYDPVLLTNKYDVQVHLDTFEHMASQINGYVDRCVFSFVEMYKKLDKNMPEIIPLTDPDKNILVKNLGTIAKRYNLEIQTCGTDNDYTMYGVKKSGCVSLDVLGKANNCVFKDLKHKGMRDGCSCIENRDIGAYDSCPSGCKYCYANNDIKKVEENCRLHDIHSPLLIGRLQEDDVVHQGIQKSLLLKNHQKTLEYL